MRIWPVLFAIPVVIASACGQDTGGEARKALEAPVERPACTVDLPAQWLDAIATSAVDTGGISATPRSIGPAGEVVAVMDSGGERELLLIGADKSVRELFAMPQPDLYTIGYAGIDERWILFAVVRHPRNANGVLPQVTRIELIDRQSGAVRTVAEQSAADVAARPERNVLDNVVLSDGKAYWITRDTYNGPNGVVHSFDPTTATRTDVESGPISDLRASAPWVTTTADLPAAVAGIPSADMASVGTDGTSFAWIIDVAQGGRGIGYWSPQTGVVRVSGVDLEVTEFVRPVLVFDSFVIVGAGGMTVMRGASATIIDIRSGAVAELKPRKPWRYDMVAASKAGTLALNLWAGPGRGPKEPDRAVGLLRSGALNPLSC
jgi:hypothetical protein